MKNNVINGLMLLVVGLAPAVMNASNNNNKISKTNVGALINRFEPQNHEVKSLLKLSLVQDLLSKEENTKNKTSKELNDEHILDAFTALIKKYFDDDNIGSWGIEDCKNVFLDLLSFLDQKTDLLSKGGEKQVKNYLSGYSEKKIKLVFNLLNYFGAPSELLKCVEKPLIKKISSKLIQKFEQPEQKPILEKDAKTDDLFFSEINFGEEQSLENEIEITVPLNSSPNLLPDGTITTTNPTNGFITLWNQLTGEAINTLKAPAMVPEHMSSSPDGRYMVSPASVPNGKLSFFVLDLKNSSSKNISLDIPSFASYDNEILTLDDGIFVIRVQDGLDAILYFISLETGTVVKKIEYKNTRFDNIFLNKPRTQIILVNDKVFRVLDLKSGETGKPFTPWNEDGRSVFSRTYSSPRTYSSHGTFVIKDTEVWLNNQQDKKVEFPDGLEGIFPFFSPDEKHIVFFNPTAPGFWALDLETGKRVFEMKGGPNGTTDNIIGFTQEGNFFITQSADAAYVWDTSAIDEETGQWRLENKIKGFGGETWWCNNNSCKVVLGFDRIGFYKPQSNTFTVKSCKKEKVNFGSTAQRLAFKMLKDAENQKKTLKISVSSEPGLYIGQLPDDVLKYFIKKGVLILVPEEKSGNEEKELVEKK